MTDQSSEEQTKSPVEAAVDALVYAPIGLLFEGASLLPQLVEKGRSQVAVARMLGKFAVEQAGEEATKTAGKLQDQAAGLLDILGGAVTPLSDDNAAPAAPKPAPATKAKPARKPAAKRSTGAAREAARKVAGVTPASRSTTSSNSKAASARATSPNAAGDSKDASTTATTAPAAAAAAVAGEVTTLAIPDYDGLSASHVVNRLAGLSPAELEAVRLYELANRGRKTILSKVAQLQSS